MEEVDVLIVGGGATGLTASILLTTYGIDTLLVSKYAETSRLPKAHLLSMKTMEIFRELGLEPAIRVQATPPANMRYVGWYAGLAGPSPDHGREIARLGAWGRGHEDIDWRQASATSYANLTQSRLEPLLRHRAEQLAAGRVRFNTSFVSFEEDGDGIIATLKDGSNSALYQVKARYLLACDGGRTVGPQIGITMEGDLAVATNVTVHFSADLSNWARDSEVLIRTIFNPDAGRPCVLVPVGPDRWGPLSEEWVLHFISFPGDHKQYDEQTCLALMRESLGLPDLEPQIHVINHWPLDAVVASQLRVGRFFILGDAAHRMPPSGGHGLNTAVQDAYNLCWKLAAVLRGGASDALLDTYAAERRPVAERTVASAFANWQNARLMGAALEFGGGRSKEEMWESLHLLWSGEGQNAERLRENLEAALVASLTTYNHLNVNFGYSYQKGALAGYDTSDLEPLDEIQIYRPSTRPGHSVPNAIIEDQHGSSLLADELGSGHFTLIAGEEGSAWCKAATLVAAGRGLKLTAFTLGATSGDRLDMRREWERQREIGKTGAILVRPDRFIAWRSLEGAEEPVTVLEEVFTHILGDLASHGGNGVPGSVPIGNGHDLTVRSKG